MANISTSSTLSGRDFVTKEAPLENDDFLTTFNNLMQDLVNLDVIKDETSFSIELNKLRKRIKNIIKDHFEGSLSILENEESYQNQAQKFKKDIQLILTKIQ